MAEVQVDTCSTRAKVTVCCVRMDEYSLVTYVTFIGQTVAQVTLFAVRGGAVRPRCSLGHFKTKNNSDHQRLHWDLKLGRQRLTKVSVFRPGFYYSKLLK